MPEVLETVAYIVFTVLPSVMQFQYNNMYKYYTAAAWLWFWLPTLDVRMFYVCTYVCMYICLPIPYTTKYHKAKYLDILSFFNGH